VSTVSQLRTAIKLEPRPDPTPAPEPRRGISKTTGGPGGEYTTWKITLPKLDAARLQAALDSHREALIAEWTRARDTHAGQDPYGGADPLTGRMTDLSVPMPTTADAFMNLVDAGADLDAARRPHGARSTVIAHLDLDTRHAGLHLGPLLSVEERRFLLCDVTCEVWFQRRGQVVGAGRATPHREPAVASRSRAPRPRHPRGPRLRCHPRSACSSPAAWGGRRPHRTVEPGVGVSVSPPDASPRRDHHHRARRAPRGHRPGRHPTDQPITGPPTQPTPTGGATLRMPNRRTRRLVVV